MNGKQAKRLRRAAKMVAKGQGFPPLAYDEKTITSQRLINTAAGSVVLPAKTIVKRLADCERRIYQSLKKLYKSGEPIFD